MKIELPKGLVNNQNRRLGHIAIGTTFLATSLNESTDQTEAFLRTYNGAVSLTHPRRTWSVADNCLVLGYQPVKVRVIVTLLEVDTN